MGVGVDGGIVTPEAVLLELRAAGLASRMLAKSLDLLVMFAVFSAGTYVVALVGAGLTGGQGGPGTVAVILLTLWVFAVFLVLPIVMEVMTRGRSLGKMALSMRVVTMEGGPTTFRHALGRGLLQPFEVYTGLAVFPGLFTRPTRRFGDLISGTFVISERVDARTAVPTAFLPPWGYEPYVAALDVGRIDDSQYVLIRSLLLRCHEMSPEARWHLTVGLADGIRALVTPQPHHGIAPEVFLQCVAGAFQRRSESSLGRQA